MVGIFQVQPDRLYLRMSIESGTDRNHRNRARFKAVYTHEALATPHEFQEIGFCDSLTGSSRLVKNGTPSNCSNEAALSRDTSSIGIGAQGLLRYESVPAGVGSVREVAFRHWGIGLRYSVSLA